VLPEPLEARYEYLGDLPHGAQADVRLCRRRDDGELVVIKLYRFEAGRLDLDALAAVERAHSAHVVRTIERGEHDGEPWEVQEYCEHGSLVDLRRRHGGTLEPDVFRAVVGELCEALAHLHERSVVHRDIKPENVLVRAEDPLDLVLADFGLATELVVTRDVRSVAGTWAYSAPESLHGSLSYAADWWSLGVTLHEALTGRHLFADPEGRMLDDPHIRVALMERSYELTGVSDGPLRHLLAGLLTHSWQHRWSADEVRRWLRGETPEVWNEAAGSPAPTAATLGYTFAGTVCRAPGDLARAVREHWDDAGDLVAGRVDPGLTAWLMQFPCGPAATAVLKSGGTPGATLVGLQKVLDPESPAQFRGTDLTAEGMAVRLSAARSGDSAARAWAVAMRRERVLGALAAATGVAAFAEADRRLVQWTREQDALVAKLPGARQPEARTALDLASGELLTAALGGDHELTLASERAVEKAADAAWAAPVLAAAREAGPEALGVHATAATLLPLVAQQLRDEAARRAAEQVAAQHAEADRAAAAARRAEDERKEAARRAWRSSLAPRLTWRTIFAAGFGLTSALTLDAGGEPTDQLLSTAAPFAISGIAAVALTELVEFAAGRRRLSGRWALMTVSVFLATGPVLSAAAGHSALRGPLLALPWWLAAGWIVRLLLARWLDRAGARSAEQARPVGKAAAAARVAAGLSSVGIVTGAAVFVILRVDPGVLSHPASVMNDLGGWPGSLYFWLTDHLPEWDPLGLGAQPARVPWLAATSLLLTAFHRDLRRWSRRLAVVTVVIAALVSVLVFLAMPWGVVALLGGVGSVLVGALIFVGVIWLIMAVLSS
jgi:hypothetical protein